jgi:hypothetical protein
LKAGSCLVLIHRRTVVLLTPQRLAIKPTDIYSGVHCSYPLGKLTSRPRYWIIGIVINQYRGKLEQSAYVLLTAIATFEYTESKSQFYHRTGAKVYRNITTGFMIRSPGEHRMEDVTGAENVAARPVGFYRGSLPPLSDLIIYRCSF